jgi:tetratricopeptide (TPR) repeat protein
LVVLYPHPGEIAGWQIVGTGLLILLVSLVAITVFRQRLYIAVGWFWYLGTLVPVIGLAQAGPQAMADRFTYIPLIGMFIIIVWGGSELVAGWRYKKIWIAATAALLLIMMTATWMQVRYWENSITLFERAVEVTTNNYLAQNILGSVLVARGRVDEAVSHYSKALRERPDSALTHYNLGVALKEKRRIDEAIGHYREALRINPQHAEAHNNLGELLIGLGEIDEGIAHLRKSLKIKPTYAAPHYNWGRGLARQDKLDKAIGHFSEALRIKPYHAQAHNNLGAVLFKKGKVEEAVFHFRQALRIKPDYPLASKNLRIALAEQRKGIQAKAKVEQQAPGPASANPAFHYRLGNMYKAKGQWEEAIEEYQKALSLQPGFTDAMNNLALVYVMQGEHDKALPLYMKIIELKPESYVPYYNVACMYARQHKEEEAIVWLRQAVSRGFKDWDHLKSDEDLKNIRHTLYFKELTGRAGNQS